MFIHRILQAFSEKTNCLDTIPFFGHMKALIHHYLDETELAAISFKGATHNTGVIFFGVLGGHFGDSAGSIVGCVIGGVLVDIPISTMPLTSTPYGYFKNLRTFKSRDMIAGEWFHLLKLIFKDLFTGVLALYAYNKYKIGMETCFDFCSFIKDIELEIHLDSLEKFIDWLGGIPIISEIQVLKFEYEMTHSHVQTFKWAIRKAVVAVFGIGGGYLAGFKRFEVAYVGSITGGIIGGLLFDVFVTQLTSFHKDYTPCHYIMLGRNMKKIDWTVFLLYTVKDGISGFKPLYAYTILILALKSFFSKPNRFAIHRIGLKEKIERDMSGNMYEVIAQRDMSAYINVSEPTTKIDMSAYINVSEPTTKIGYGEEIQCDLNTCEKCDISTETDYRDLKISAKLLITAMNARGALTKLLIADLPVRRPVAKIFELKSGDHIVYERKICGLYVYDHHAIVANVFPDDNKYSVFEQAPFRTSNELMSRGKAWIQWNEKHFGNGSIYKIDHGEAALSNDAVWMNARKIFLDIQLFKKKYNVAFNNCEHFANFCATNVLESQQVQKTTVNVLPFIMSGMILATRNIYPINLLMS